jgi:hypothetical protein
VTRGNAATYSGGHPPEHDLAGSVRTQGWDWEGALQTHEKNGKRATACARGCTRKLNEAQAGTSLTLQNFLRLRESLSTPPRCDSAPKLREGRNGNETVQRAVPSTTTLPHRPRSYRLPRRRVVRSRLGQWRG